MGFLDFFSKQTTKEKYYKKLYSQPENLVTFEFANRTDIIKFAWFEPSCVSLEIDTNTEYKVVTHDKTFRIEFDVEESFTFYMQDSFGFILYKRPTSKELINHHPWELEMDWSDIN